MNTEKQNEKYVGDAHLGKYTTTNVFENIVKENKEIEQSYYIKDSHPAIISREDFEKVKELLKRTIKMKQFWIVSVIIIMNLIDKGDLYER